MSEAERGHEGNFQTETYDEEMRRVLSRQRLQGVGSMRMEQEVNFPVVSTQQFVRFQINSTGRGILDSDAEVSLSLRATAQGEAKTMIHPILQGCKCLVEKASLKIGGKTISTQEGSRFYHALDQGFKPMDDQKSLETYTTGSNDYFEASNLLDEQTKGTTIGDIGCLRVGGRSFQSPNPFLYVRRAEATGFNAPAIFSIKLDELFPFLKNNQLPLMSMNDDVFVELSLNVQDADGSKVIYDSSVLAPAFASGDVEFNTDEARLNVTHLYYDDALMNRIQREHDTRGLTFIYEDLQFVNRGIVASGSATGEQTAILDIGGQGKVVRKLLVAPMPQTTNGLLGLYSMPSDRQKFRATAGAGYTDAREDYQLEINDRLVFTRPLDTPAKLSYHYSVCGQNGDCFVPKALSSVENTNTLGASQFSPNINWAGVVQSDLEGQYAPRGFDFTHDRSNRVGNGVRVGSKPIRMTYHRVGTAGVSSNSAKAFRCWLVYERQFQLKNGVVSLME